MNRSVRRIAIVTQDPAHRGGVLRLVEYLYRLSVSAGLQPEILHYGGFAYHPELHVSTANLLRGELNLAPEEKQYTFQGMNARAIGAWFPEWEPQRLAGNRLWTDALSQYDSAILVTGSAHTGLPLAERGKPFIAWVSSIVEDDRRERLSKKTLSNYLERAGLASVLRAERSVLDHASRILAVSTVTRSRIGTITHKAVEVWPFPIDTHLFNAGNSYKDTSSTEARFLFVGRANDPRKQIELFLEACSSFKEKNPTIPFRATVISSVRMDTSELSFPIEWLSGLTESELAECYHSSTALLLTSEQEGLGIAAMEAMACGLPVISTHCGGPETFIEDGINSFFANSVEEFAEVMSSLAVDGPLRKRISNAACETMERQFSERVWNEKFLTLLAQVK